jgi:hypothetical protein
MQTGTFAAWLGSGKGVLEGHHINKDVTSLEMANRALEAR